MLALNKAFVAVPSTKINSQPRAHKALTVCSSLQTERRSFIIDGTKTLAAGLVAAALFAGVPSAEAKVILAKSEVKNLVNDTPAASAPSAKKEVAKRPPAAAETSEGFDAKPLVLPLSLVAIAGGAVAINALDPGFGEFVEEWGAKDSRSYAGYETGLKDTPFFGGSGSIPSSAPGGKKGNAKKSEKKTEKKTEKKFPFF